jgi:hypothetical protein
VEALRSVDDDNDDDFGVTEGGWITRRWVTLCSSVQPVLKLRATEEVDAASLLGRGCGRACDDRSVGVLV